MLRSALLYLLIASLPACSEPEPVHAEFFVFGTIVEVDLHDVGPDQAQSLVASLQQEFQRMHQEWHAWEPGALERVNGELRTFGTADATPDIVELVRRSQELEKRSGGRFNPATGELIRLWGFHTSEFPVIGPPPDQEAIQALVDGQPSMLDIEVEGLKLRTSNPAVQLDFGAIAKGYAVDLAIGHISAAGVSTAIVNAGGDMKTLGARRERPWRIAIQDPLGGLAGSLNFTGSRAVFTSGNYRRFRQDANKRYPHILDPRSGWPVQEIASATVIAANGTTADAAATAIMVAGLDDWLHVARRMGVEAALVVDENGRIFATEEMARYLSPEPGRSVVFGN